MASVFSSVYMVAYSVWFACFLPFNERVRRHLKVAVGYPAVRVPWDNHKTALFCGRVFVRLYDCI
jgi:hypothetical protein